MINVKLGDSWASLPKLLQKNQAKMYFITSIIIYISCALFTMHQTQDSESTIV